MAHVLFLRRRRSILNGANDAFPLRPSFVPLLFKYGAALLLDSSVQLELFSCPLCSQPTTRLPNAHGGLLEIHTAFPDPFCAPSHHFLSLTALSDAAEATRLNRARWLDALADARGGRTDGEEDDDAADASVASERTQKLPLL